MRFAQPEWLWGLATLPLLIALLMLEHRRHLNGFGKVIAEKLWPIVVPELDRSARLRRFWVWTLALLFGLLAMARPQWGMHEETSKTTGLDVMVVLDISSSMNTEDVVPSRLKKAKRLLKTLSERLAGDRLGLVFFAKGAYLASPLTTDTEYFRRITESAESDLLKSQGTDIGAGLEIALKAVDRGAEHTQGAGARASTVVLLLSDGEDQEERAAARVKDLAQRGIRFLVVGVGTEKGAPIPVRDEAGTLRGYKRDSKGSVVTSAFNPNALKKLADIGKGRFWNLTSSEGEIDEIVGDLSSLSRGELDERKVVVFEERYQYPLSIAVVLFLIEMSIPLRRRRALVALILAVGLSGLTFGLAPLAHAGPSVKAWLENEKGISELGKGQIAEAQKHFGTAQALAPDAPELQFNQGTTQFAAGDLESAEKLLNEAIEKSRARLGTGAGAHDSIGGKALFNLGALKSQQKKPEDAIRAYSDAIREAERTGDTELAKDARKNLELAVQQMQQQKQSKDSEDSKNSKDSKDTKDSKESKNSENKAGDQKNDGSDSKEGKNEKDDKHGKDDQSKSDDEKKSDVDKRYRQNAPQKPFESKKLSEEDVERVMSELSNRERDLKARMNKKNAGNAEVSPNDPNGKDW